MVYFGCSFMCMHAPTPTELGFNMPELHKTYKIFKGNKKVNLQINNY